MTISILHTADKWWVQTPTGAARIRTDAATTRELLSDRAAIDAAAHNNGVVPVDSLELLSPITTPCRVVAQATNYASHVKDVGRDPAKTPLTFFRKASGSVTGPFGDIIKPDIGWAVVLFRRQLIECFFKVYALFKRVMRHQFFHMTHDSIDDKTF